MCDLFAAIPNSLKQALFCTSQFQADLAVSSSAIPVYKRHLALARQQLNQRFDKGEDIEHLVMAQAWLVDQLLTKIWHEQTWQQNIALIAVGGYGRGELHPHSDIDLLILLDSNDYEAYQCRIEQFLMTLWDIGLTVGSSVRSLAESAFQAAQDLSIVTSLIESRVIAGPSYLHKQLMSLIDVQHMWTSQDYFEAKLAEQKQRHHKYNDTEYDLEPNLKSSPGGLRDLHMLGWVARRHYHTDNPAELLELGFLTAPEYYQFIQCRKHLWSIRWALHRLTRRGENRLLFDYQKALAVQLGYQDRESALAVEQFMQSYFRTVMVVSQLKDLLLQHFDHDILNNAATEVVKPLNVRFCQVGNYIDAIDDDVFSDYPPALLEVFVLLTKEVGITGPTAATIRAIRRHRYLVDDAFRKDPRCNKLFLELMQGPYSLTSTLRRMARYGILGRYIPVFGKIIGQMQYDLFHSYTVDAHTLLMVRYMRSFLFSNALSRFPIAAKIMPNIEKPELLYLAGLFHDIGKGRGGDHAHLGAVDAMQFCQVHGLGYSDTALVEWLVRHHLVLSMTAQKKDLSDPTVIHDFAKFVGTSERLRYLYLLTIADINATNPNLWNGWRVSLIQRLYQQTAHQLKMGMAYQPDIADYVRGTQQEALQLLEAEGADLNGVKQLWAAFPDDYFLKLQSQEVVWQSLGLLAHRSKHALVLVQEYVQQSEDGYENQGTKVFIHAPDQSNLFAVTVIAFNQLSLAIQDARIITSDDGYSLNTYTVLEHDGSAVGDNPLRTQDIQQALLHAVNHMQELPPLSKRRTPRKLKHFYREPNIVLSNQISPRQTILQIYAIDRPGLLALIGKTFVSLKLQIHSAKIATFGEKVEDSFVIADETGNPLMDAEQCRVIQSLLKKVLQQATRT